MLERIGAAWRFVKNASDLEEPGGLDGLILPGGESTTLLKFLDEEGLWEPLRRFMESQPVFGTCAGAILMAEQVENPPQRSLGGVPMTVRRNAYGRQLASSIRIVEVDLELQIGPEAGLPLEVVLIRAPIIAQVAPEVKVLARLEGCPALVRYGSLLAGTFHPELTSDTRVHRYFTQLVCSHHIRAAG